LGRKWRNHMRGDTKEKKKGFDSSRAKNFSNAANSKHQGKNGFGVARGGGKCWCVGEKDGENIHHEGANNINRPIRR